MQAHGGAPWFRFNLRGTYKSFTTSAWLGFPNVDESPDSPRSMVHGIHMAGYRKNSLQRQYIAVFTGGTNPEFMSGLQS